MKIDIILTPHDQYNIARVDSRKNAVVIDILRASSTIVSALEAGAEKIFCAQSLEEAFNKKEELVKIMPVEKVLLGGERKGLKVEGFQMGNSPREYMPQTVKGRTLVISSTNGTRAIRNSSQAGRIIVGSFLNARAAADFLLQDNKNIIFYLAGRENDFSYEDAAGAGAIIFCVLSELPGVELSDSSRMCFQLFKNHKEDLLDMLRATFHGNYLVTLGLEKDLEFCSRFDVSTTVPIVDRQGWIIP
ncbi:MAG: 2-phosphosulfolactate phosphatase [Vulcanimicrobiota bacterium]